MACKGSSSLAWLVALMLTGCAPPQPAGSDSTVARTCAIEQNMRALEALHVRPLEVEVFLPPPAEKAALAQGPFVWVHLPARAGLTPPLLALALHCYLEHRELDGLWSIDPASSPYRAARPRAVVRTEDETFRVELHFEHLADALEAARRARTLPNTR